MRVFPSTLQTHAVEYNIICKTRTDAQASGDKHKRVDLETQSVGPGHTRINLHSLGQTHTGTQTH